MFFEKILGRSAVTTISNTETSSVSFRSLSFPIRERAEPKGAEGGGGRRIDHAQPHAGPHATRAGPYASPHAALGSRTQVYTKVWQWLRRPGRGLSDPVSLEEKIHITMSAYASERRLLVRSSTLSSPPPVGGQPASPVRAGRNRPRTNSALRWANNPSEHPRKVEAFVVRTTTQPPALSSSMPSWDGRLSPSRAVESDRLWKAPAHHPPAPEPSHSRRKSRPQPHSPPGFPQLRTAPATGPGDKENARTPHPREVEAFCGGDDDPTPRPPTSRDRPINGLDNFPHLRWTQTPPIEFVIAARTTTHLLADASFPSQDPGRGGGGQRPSSPLTRRLP